MNVHTLVPRAAYIAQRYPTIKALEDIKFLPYNDGRGYVTIGIGFKLADASVRAEVLEKMGYTNPQLLADLNRYLGELHFELNGAIQDVLNKIVQKYIPNGTFEFASEDQVKELFNGTGAVGSGLSRIYEDRVDAWLTRHSIPVVSMPDSAERMVLLSLAYNGALEASNSLANAIRTDDRAEAWFQIRYRTNPVATKHANGITLLGDDLDQYSKGIEEGLAKRRDYESTLFGLYAPGTDLAAVGHDEALKIYRMLEQHRTDMLRLEMHYGDDAHGTVPDRQNQVTQALNDYKNFTGAVATQTLRQSLDPARNAILRDVHARFAAEEAQLGAPFNDQWLSTDIYAAPAAGGVLDASPVEALGGVFANGSTDLMVGSATASTTLKGGKGNDTLLGGAESDTLDGGEGNDTLVGGGGNDVLHGGADDDTLMGDGGSDDQLYGEAGFDTYIYSSGDGRSRIRGNDDDGQIKFDGITLSPDLIHKYVDSHDRTAWTWIQGGRRFYATVTDGDPATEGTLSIREELSSPDDALIIEQFSFGNLGLNFAATDEVAMFAGPPGSNPYTDPSYSYVSGSMTLKEGFDRQVTAFFNTAVGAGNTVRLTLPGASGDIAVRKGDDIVQFDANGVVILTLQPGQTSVTFTLFSQTDVDVDRNLQLTAALLDSQGNALSDGSHMSVALDAVAEPNGTADTIYIVDPNQQGGGTATGLHTDFYGGSHVAPHYFTSWNVLLDPASSQSVTSEIIDMSLGVPESGSDFVTVTAGLGDSKIIGSAYRDVLEDGVSVGALPYAGPIFSGAGGDEDILSGGLGNDVLQTHGGDDVSHGGDGDDIIIDTPITSVAEGYSSTTWVLTAGNSNRDRLYGDDGNDILIGGAGAGYFDGGSGNDEIYGGAHGDTIIGGDGNDVLSGDSRQTGAIWLYGNGQLFAGFNLSVDFGGGNIWNSGVVVEDTDAPGKDFLDGGDGDDKITGGGDDDTLMGGNGNDYLQGDTLFVFGGTQAMYSTHGTTPLALQGNDRLYGEAGADTLRGGGGDDLLDGGADDDVLYGDDAPSGSPDVDAAYQGNDVLHGGQGNDFLSGDGGSDALFGDDGDDQLFGDGSNTPESIQGDDYIEGGVGADTIAGLGGADTIIGGAGADLISGGKGDDVIDGGDDNDSATGGAGNDLMAGGAGDDQLVGDDQGDTSGDDEIHGEDGADSLYGGGGDDTLYGDAGDDVLVGGFGDAAPGSGNDSLNGGEGDDQLFGEDGNDVLIGGLGQDILQGGDGNDVLIADSGDDALFGEAGDDRFVLNVGAGHVQVTDIEGSNILVFGAGVSPADLALAMAPGQAHINYSSTDFAFMDLATLHSITSVQFADGSTLSGYELRHRFVPGPIFNGGPNIDLTPGVSAAEIGFMRRNDDLVLTYGGSVSNWINVNTLASHGALAEQADGAAYGQPSGTQAVVLTNWYRRSSQYLTGLLADGGTPVDFVGLATNAPATYDGTADDDVLTGTAQGETLLAGAGVDEIDAGNGADDLTGGSGDDSLLGGAGDDTYRFAVGDGSDTLEDSSGTNDVIKFAAGIAPGDLTLTQSEAALTVQIGAAQNGDVISIANMFYRGGQRQPIERFEFADGTIWNAQDIESHITGNHRPTVATPLLDQGAPAGQFFTFTVPGGTFVDPDAGDQLLYWAAQTDGNPLPAWLQFDGATGTLSGTRPSFDTTIYSIRINATDLAGVTTTDDFNVSVRLNQQIGTAGNDTLVGTSLDDVLEGRAGNDTLTGADGNDELNGEAGYDLLQGGAGADLLLGGSGGDTLDGGSGNDRLEGGTGSDRYVFRAGFGNDVVIDHSGYDTIEFSADSGIGLADLNVTRQGNDLRIATGSNSVIVQGWYDPTADNRIDSLVVYNGGLPYSYSATQLEAMASGVDSAPEKPADLGNLFFAPGETVSFQVPANTFMDVGSQGALAYSASDLPAWLSFDPATRTLSGVVPSDASSVFNSSITATDGLAQSSFPAYFNVIVIPGLIRADGTSGADVLSGDSQPNYLRGFGGNDTLIADGGVNVLDGGDGDDTIIISTNGDYVYGGDGNDTIRLANPLLDGGNYQIYAGAGDDHIELHGGGNIYGGTGDDYIAGVTQARGEEDDDHLIGVNVATSFGDSLNGGAGNDLLEGLDGDDQLVGEAGDDVLLGGAGADHIYGDQGNDTYDGGQGNDDLRDVYADGNDLYKGFYSVSGIDKITDFGGQDTIEFQAVDTRIDQLGFARVNLNSPSSSTKNDLRITISSGNGEIGVYSWFQSGGAIENLILYYQGLRYRYTDLQINSLVSAQNRGPVVNEGIVGQTAALGQAFSLQVAQNLFSDAESQFSLQYSATLANGSALPSWLTFNAGTRTFSGTPGTSDAGVITVRITGQDAGGLTASYDMALGVGIDPIIGTSAAELLSGGSGTDFILGRNGNDYLIGGGGDDYLYGEAGNDTLQGGQGADTVVGGAGDDVYLVDDASDVVIEQGSSGTDEIRASISYVLPDEVENLTLLEGTGAVNATGNLASNVLRGNSNANTLDGSLGTDTLIGGAGDDTYVIRDSTDIVVEDSNSGMDTATSYVSWTLAANVENLTLIGNATIDGTGNADANHLTGNALNNTLDGGLGADVMAGGAGNDIYLVDNANDQVTELAGEGTDEVRTTVSYVLQQSDVEKLTLLGTAAINGTGNALNNTLVGNSGNNILDGGAGNDTLQGGQGNDTYIVDSASDTITEGSNQGTDTVQSWVSWTLSTTQQLENLTLLGSTNLSATGNSLANTLTGNSGNNALDGKSGADTMIGGAGDDTYAVDSANDVVTENDGEGVDTVTTTLITSYTLGAYVENLTLGMGGITGTGNGLNNVLTGNSSVNTLTGGGGDDVLDGGSGADTMIGGLGDDVYKVNQASEIVTENPNEGLDRLESQVSITTLQNDVEILFLTSTATTGGGNGLNNLLRGNASANTLTGAAGVDILEGGSGVDTMSDSGGATLFNGGANNDIITSGSASDLLIGGNDNDSLTTGTGNDVIAFNLGDKQDTVSASTGIDNVLSIGGGARYADLVFSKSGTNNVNLVVKVGATDQITFTNYFSNHSVSKLQMIIEGTTDYDPTSSDVKRNNKIETYDFEGLVSDFLAANVTTWAVTTAALTNRRQSGSDTAALGGDLAYRYGRFGGLSDISFTPALGILGDSGFGTLAQGLLSTASLQDTSVRLS